MSYPQCPACNHKGRRATKLPQVFTCKRCGALYGDCYLGESYALVQPYFAPAENPAERQRYYDLTCLGSDGITRRHGWFDPETRLVTQVG